MLDILTSNHIILQKTTVPDPSEHANQTFRHVCKNILSFFDRFTHIIRGRQFENLIIQVPCEYCHRISV